MGLLIEFGMRTPSSTKFYGYVFAALLIAIGVLTSLASVRAMPDSTRKKVGRVSTYVVGGLLILVGIGLLLTELGKGKPSLMNFHLYVHAAIFVASGVLI
jgi:hypothetical protein